MKVNRTYLFVTAALMIVLALVSQNEAAELHRWALANICLILAFAFENDKPDAS